MTLLVVLILVVLWAAVLGPRIVRRLRDREPLGSVDSFYHELHLLDLAAPKTVAPANRLDTAYAGRPIPGATGYPSVSSMPGRPSLVLLPPVGSADETEGRGRPGTRDAGQRGTGLPGAGVPTNATLAARDRVYRVRQGRRRRRDVLLILLGTVVGTGLLGTMHSFRILWDLTVLATVLLVVYVALAVRVQSLAVASRGRPPASRPARPRPTARSRHLQDDADAYGYAYYEDEVAHAPTSARAGYPGAWDEELLPLRRVVAGV